VLFFPNGRKAFGEDYLSYNSFS